MFTFSDLFAGIGGFHAALSAAGGVCEFASEIDPWAAQVYENNWRMRAHGDIVPLTEGEVAVPAHDVLAAGFPCQPFSKSGYQRGMEETRGTLFFNICRILEARKPAVILLENVRNLAGPRQKETWVTIVRTLRQLGYRVSDKPAIFSPHLLPLALGGRPQVRERAFITGTYVGPERAMAETDVEPIITPKTIDWARPEWDLKRDLRLDPIDTIRDLPRYKLSAQEVEWITVWNEFLQATRGENLSGFPIWADSFRSPALIPGDTPGWKVTFLQKNSALYARNRPAIDAWLKRNNNLEHFPASRRKLEWQAQGDPNEVRDLLKTVMQFRPSGIRAKRPTYLPALVAITQTSIYGPELRRITPSEASRLQGLPAWFDFGNQGDAATYKQLGNGVNVGAAYFVFCAHVRRDADELKNLSEAGRRVVDAVLLAGDVPLLPDRPIGDRPKPAMQTPRLNTLPAMAR